MTVRTAPTENLALTVDHVGFGYDAARPILGDIDIAISAGSVTGIVGPSGCGKSTLLSLIAGLRQPSAGVIRYAPTESGRHPLTMVFQKDTLLPWKTVSENIALASLFGSTRRRDNLLGGEPVDDRVRRLLDMAHLAAAADAYPYQLSGGMRRRVAFAAAVAPNPQILLLDEPFSSVDEPTRIGIHQDVFEIIRTSRITTILVTHDLAEAITLSDQVLILSKGPSRVSKTHVIPFTGDRDMLQLRSTSEYSAAYAELWNDLSLEISGVRRDQ